MLSCKRIMKPFIRLLLLLVCIYTSSKPIPAISSFNYQTDMPAIEKLLKKEWTALFWMPDYDQVMIDVIFKKKLPGDITVRNQKLFISVLKDDGSLIGFITYYQADNTTGHIELLAIDKQYKGLGYGKKLVNYVQNWLAKLGCKYIQLYVYTTNNHAIQFYKHLGFTVKNIFPGYLLFSKELKATKEPL